MINFIMINIPIRNPLQKLNELISIFKGEFGEFVGLKSLYEIG
ncbi:hypothetical protein [Methanobrevibacter sp. V14]|nr:hypothetical protein [Methanobrevibacter sp. V14]